MDENDKLAMLRAMLGSDLPGRPEDWYDDVLLAYLRLASEIILNRMYPIGNRPDGVDLPDRYNMKQCNIATFLLNKRGAEGEVAHSEASGISRTYGSADVPEAMLKDIVPRVKVVGECENC